jgi:hypothetical protein
MVRTLEFFSLQNETKMKKIGGHDPFFDIGMFHSKRWVGDKKIPVPEVMAIFQRENFLNIGKIRNLLAIKSSEKKGHGLTYFLFFLSHYGKANY